MSTNRPTTAPANFTRAVCSAEYVKTHIFPAYDVHLEAACLTHVGLRNELFMARATDDKKYVVKIYGSQFKPSWLLCAHAFVDYVQQRGCAAISAIPTRDGERLLERPLRLLTMDLDACRALHWNVAEKARQVEFWSLLAARLRETVGTALQGPFETICHGDAHAGNFVRLDDGTNLLYDYEHLGPGSPLYDIACFVAGRLRRGTRRDIAMMNTGMRSRALRQLLLRRYKKASTSFLRAYAENVRLDHAELLPHFVLLRFLWLSGQQSENTAHLGLQMSPTETAELWARVFGIW